MPSSSDVERRQVIIIGGGPAGSTTARYLAEAGVDVLVIDGRDPIGTPLQCGELIPSNDEMRRLCPDVPDIDELITTPDEAISRRVDALHLVPPSGRPLRFRFEGVILDRVAHDRALVERAKMSGADYLVGQRVVTIDDHEVVLRDGTRYAAEILVGAGGHQDPIRRSQWNEQSLNIPVKFVLMDGDFPDVVELHFGSMAPGGYAWVIPKANGANIGLGIQKRFAKRGSLNRYAEEFIGRYSGQITFRGAGSLPMSGTVSSFVKGHYVLVGDAAGMVLPSNGAGITIAMIGGRIAGQVIAEHLVRGTPLVEFEDRWRKQMGKIMRTSKRSFSLGSILFRSPDWIVNLGFNRLTKSFIWRGVTCRKVFFVL